MLKIFDFVLTEWGAWAPGMHNKADWKAWNDGFLAVGDELAEIPQSVPKMMQRRLSPLARAVFNAADQCIGKEECLPIVFSSAHGEVGRSLDMLKAIQAGEELSPTAFSLSVHNAVSGLYSIAYANHNEITVLAPGLEGIAPAFIEALGQLQEGANAVGMVLYDEPLDDFYPVSPFNLKGAFPCALALKIMLKGNGVPLRFSRSSKPHDKGEQPVQLLDFIRFLLVEEKTLILGNRDHSWRWDKI